MAEPIKLFFSYSHRDEAYRKKLEGHLSLLKRQGVISAWHDRQIVPGADWAGEISRHLTEADIVLLLVSHDFLASDYCWNIEMETALAKHERGEAVVIPVIVRPVDLEGASFAGIQALPKDAKPISTWNNRDQAWVDVARGIRRRCKELQQAREAPSSATPETRPAEPSPSAFPLPDTPAPGPSPPPQQEGPPEVVPEADSGAGTQGTRPNPLRTAAATMWGIAKAVAQGFQEAAQAAAETKRQEAEAQYNRGVMYEQGQGVEPDYAEALRSYASAALAGHAGALQWIKQAADRGDAEALQCLREATARGSLDARRELRAVAEHGDADEQFRLGEMYEHGEGGVEENLREAVRWYRLSAEQGNAVAATNLGFMYYVGQGVEQDFNEALRWSRVAAEQGEGIAQANLGEMYERGEGTEQDYAEARKWYELAAEALDADQMYRLGVMYEEGKGGEADRQAALQWYQEALEAGCADAADRIERMR